MAFKYSKGSQVIGDIIAEDDSGRDTKLDFSNNQIDLVTSGSTALSVKTAAVEITGTLNVTSNVTSSGNLLLNGGDFLSTAATFNLLTSASTTTLNVGSTGGTFTLNLGRTTNVSTTNIAAGTNTTGGATKTVNIGTNTGPAATCTVNIGSSGSLGITTLNNDVALRTGNLIGAPGTGANVMSLISSGNIVARLDVNNDSAGHKFIVQDYQLIERFSAGEDGNILIVPSSSGTGQAILVSGSNTVGGSTYIDFLRATNTSAGAVTPTKTFRLTNSGSFEIVNSAYTTTIYTLDDLGNMITAGGMNISGPSIVGKMSERITMSSAGTGSVTFDTTNNSIFYNNGPTANITANFTNVSTTTDRATSVTVILSQSATARIVNAVQINSTSSTINWANGVVPTGNANKHDIFGFSLIRSGSTWVTLGQMSTYG
jgi:hypothetical protein